MNSATIFQIQSVMILLIMYFGVYKRKERSKHVKIMAFAIAWDLILVLQIELTRGAIAKAAEIVTNPLLLKIHLFFAISSVLLYFFMIFSGRKVLKGDKDILKKHRVAGITTLVFRTATFMTSFYAVTETVK